MGYDFFFLCLAHAVSVAWWPFPCVDRKTCPCSLQSQLVSILGTRSSTCPNSIPFSLVLSFRLNDASVIFANLLLDKKRHLYASAECRTTPTPTHPRKKRLLCTTLNLQTRAHHVKTKLSRPPSMHVMNVAEGATGVFVDGLARDGNGWLRVFF